MFFIIYIYTNNTFPAGFRLLNICFVVFRRRRRQFGLALGQQRGRSHRARDALHATTRHGRRQGTGTSTYLRSYKIVYVQKELNGR